jgi:PPOX class probable F420-dependent enzyme
MTPIEGEARKLFEKPNHVVISTLRKDGSVHSTVVWADLEDGRVALNSAVGRAWPTNLERDPRITVTVYDAENPYQYVEVRGTTTSTLDGADAHIDRLAKKYLGVDDYPYRKPEEQRVKIYVDAESVRHTVA